MEFKSLTNIETSFRQIRLFALVFICLCALVTGFAVWNSYSFAEKQRQKIYVLDNGKSLMLALSQDMAQNRPVEAKSHVRRFHELFFTLSPDKGAIESNIKRSLFLADKTAFNYYKDLAEKGYYNRVISGNVTQTVEIDSVKCDFDQYPYKVNTYCLLYTSTPLYVAFSTQKGGVGKTTFTVLAASYLYYLKGYDVAAVSYTHLDVSKRQPLGYQKLDPKTYNHYTE